MAVVLVVNDDADMLDVYEAVLTELGHQPVPRLEMLPDPDSVVQIGADAVVIDLQAEAHPMAGLRVIEALRRHPATQTLPIVLSTGAVQEAKRLADQLERLGVPVLLKPFAIDQLRDVLGRVLPAGQGAEETVES